MLFLWGFKFPVGLQKGHLLIEWFDTAPLEFPLVALHNLLFPHLVALEFTVWEFMDISYA